MEAEDSELFAPLALPARDTMLLSSLGAEAEDLVDLLPLALETCEEGPSIANCLLPLPEAWDTLEPGAAETLVEDALDTLDDVPKELLPAVDLLLDLREEDLDEDPAIASRALLTGATASELLDTVCAGPLRSDVMSSTIRPLADLADDALDVLDPTCDDLLCVIRPRELVDTLDLFASASCLAFTIAIRFAASPPASCPSS